MPAEIIPDNGLNRQDDGSPSGMSGSSEVLGGGGGNGGLEGCFIATACYGDTSAPEVLILKRFRDQVLLKSKFGEKCVRFYYKTSPVLAVLIRNQYVKNFLIQFVLDPCVYLVQYSI